MHRSLSTYLQEQQFQQLHSDYESLAIQAQANPGSIKLNILYNIIAKLISFFASRNDLPFVAHVILHEIQNQHLPNMHIYTE